MNLKAHTVTPNKILPILFLCDMKLFVFFCLFFDCLYICFAFVIEMVVWSPAMVIILMEFMSWFTCVRQKTPASSVTSPKPATKDRNLSPILMVAVVGKFTSGLYLELFIYVNWCVPCAWWCRFQLESYFTSSSQDISGWEWESFQAMFCVQVSWCHVTVHTLIPVTEWMALDLPYGCQPKVRP